MTTEMITYTTTTVSSEVKGFLKDETTYIMTQTATPIINPYEPVDKRAAAERKAVISVKSFPRLYFDDASDDKTNGNIMRRKPQSENRSITGRLNDIPVYSRTISVYPHAQNLE